MGEHDEYREREGCSIGTRHGGSHGTMAISDHMEQKLLEPPIVLLRLAVNPATADRVLLNSKNEELK